MKRAIVGVATAMAFCACGQSGPNGGSSAGGAGGTTNVGGTANAGGTTDGGSTSAGSNATSAGGATNSGGASITGGTTSTSGVCSVNIPSEAGDTCDVETTRDANAPADAGAASDLARVGPYAVGHVNYTLSDTVVYSRPVAVSVWYPVDAASITSSTPPAQYPLDPWTTKLPISASTDWESLGYDRAYEGATPSGNGPFPLVVVSPGSGCDNWQYLYIGTRLASHGFVVAVTDHQGNGQWPWSSNDDQVVAMSNFPRDVSFAITELLLKNDTAGESMHGIIDPSRIALGGHSLGGYTTYALAGGDDEICDTLAPISYGWESLPYPQSACGPQPRDSRIRAIVAMDGVSQQLRYNELARISVPSLIIGETVEHGGVTDLSYFPPPQPSDPDFGLWNARPHAAIRRGDSYRVDIAIANHGSFSAWCDGLEVMASLGVDMNTASPTQTLNTWPCAFRGTFDPKNNPATRQIITTYMLAFLNTHFGREDDSWMLTSSYARQYQPNVEFFDSEACNECPVGNGEYSYRPHPCQCSVGQKDPADYFAPPVSDGGAN